MRSRFILLAATALLLAAGLLGVVGNGAEAAGSTKPPCRVGGPPANEGRSLPDRPAGPDLVIACGTSFAGPYEIAAYTGQHGELCTVFLGAAPGSGQCGAAFGESRLAHDGVLATGASWSYGPGPGPSFTAIGGDALPGVARIEVRYHRGGQKAVSTLDATLVQVEGELLDSLGRTEPFGRFAAVLPGCLIPQGIRLLAYDAEGALIGSERGRRSHFGAPCRTYSG